MPTVTFLTTALHPVTTVGCSFCSWYRITLVLAKVHVCYYGYAHPFYQWQVSYKATEKHKSHKTCLSNHRGFLSHHIMSLVIIALKVGHTHTHAQHTHIHTTHTYIHTFSYINNCSIAVGTTRRKHLIISFTVRLPIIVIKCTSGQLLVALDTGKVLNMPWLVHGRNHLPQDWFIVSGTCSLGLCIHPCLTDILLQLPQHAVKVRRFSLLFASRGGLEHITGDSVGAKRTLK